MLQHDGPEELAHYLSVGRSANANIEASLAAADRGWNSVESCLDMACGYGRVMRHIAARIGGARITACEVMPEGSMIVPFTDPGATASGAFPRMTQRTRTSPRKASSTWAA